MKKAFTYILIVLFFSTSVGYSFYAYNDNNISVLAEQPQEEENSTVQNEEVKYLTVYQHKIEYNYSILQETKFALFKHFPDEEDHSSMLDFPPKFI